MELTRTRRRPLRDAQYDWVIVLRVITGRKPPRHLTSYERIEVVRLMVRSAIPYKNHPAAIAVGERQVVRWLTAHKESALLVGLDSQLRFSVPGLPVATEPGEWC